MEKLIWGLPPLGGCIRTGGEHNSQSGCRVASRLPVWLVLAQGYLHSCQHILFRGTVFLFVEFMEETKPRAAADFFAAGLARDVGPDTTAEDSRHMMSSDSEQGTIIRTSSASHSQMEWRSLDIGLGLLLIFVSFWRCQQQEVLTRSYQRCS